MTKAFQLLSTISWFLLLNSITPRVAVSQNYNPYPLHNRHDENDTISIVLPNSKMKNSELFEDPVDTTSPLEPMTSHEWLLFFYNRLYGSIVLAVLTYVQISQI